MEEQQPATLEELGQALGIPDIRQAVEEILRYLYQVDQRLQALNGQPTVTQTIQPHIGNGHLEVHVTRPAIPESLIRPGQLRRDGEQQ